MASIPDATLLEGLRQRRDRSRNDYPVHLLWGVVLLRIVLPHVSFEATLGELHRNVGLRERIGIASEKEVPKARNGSRFLEVLGQEPHRTHLRKIFEAMGRRLATVVPDLGQDTAGDSTALHTWSKSHVQPEGSEGLASPTAGRKERTDDDGSVPRIVEWFG